MIRYRDKTSGDIHEAKTSCLVLYEAPDGAYFEEPGDFDEDRLESAGGFSVPLAYEAGSELISDGLVAQEPAATDCYIYDTETGCASHKPGTKVPVFELLGEAREAE